MKAFAIAFAIAIAIVATLSGCGGCQPPEDKTTPGAAAPAEPKQPAPAAQAPLAPATEQPPADAEEDDCFVVLDAVPDYGPAPLEVQFTAEVDCTSGDPTYVWTFGDGSPTSSEPSPKHTYQKVGEYPASVVITGPQGGTDTDELDILVEE